MPTTFSGLTSATLLTIQDISEPSETRTPPLLTSRGFLGHLWFLGRRISSQIAIRSHGLGLGPRECGGGVADGSGREPRLDILHGFGV